MRALAILIASIAVPCATGCATRVVRISNGSAQAERSIAPQAYAAYARARLNERTGDRRRAISSYEEVLQLDSAADEAWVRLGALRCSDDMTEANRCFANAARINPQSPALRHELALCALSHGDCVSARSNADAAMHLAPRDPVHSRLVIRVYLACGAPEQAERLAWAHVAVYPTDTGGWLSLAKIVEKRPHLQAQLQRRAAERVVRQYAYWTVLDTAASRHSPTRIDLSAAARVELEHALATTDRAAAQRAARELRLGVTELMDLAYDLGALEFAREQAIVAGQIKPHDATIWLRRLDLADRLRNDEEFELLLKQAPPNLTNLGKVDTERLLGLVARRTGAQSAAVHRSEARPKAQ